MADEASVPARSTRPLYYPSGDAPDFVRHSVPYGRSAASAGGILGVRKQIGGKQIHVLKQQICFQKTQVCFFKNKFVFMFTNR